MATETVGGTKTQREYNLGLERKFLQELYRLHKPEEEFQASYFKMAEVTGIPSNIVGNVIQLLEKQNLLTRRFMWVGGHPTKGSSGGGRQAYWTLRTSYDHANHILSQSQDKILSGSLRRGTNNQVNGSHKQMALPVATKNAETKSPSNLMPNSIKTNDAIDKAMSLVSEVRNYMKAQDLINENLRGLRDAGIVVDEDAYLKSVKIVPDATAEAIALVIPYIDHLENTRENK